VTALDEIMAYLEGTLHLTPAQAAGVAGNLQVESGFSPTAYNDKEGAIGIAQWEGGRRQALDAYAAATGGSETSLATQLGFLGQELHGSEAGAFTALLNTSDAGSAAAVFDQKYERSSGSARSKRMADAEAIAGGHPTATGDSTSSTSSSSSSSSSSSGSIASGIGGWMDLGGTLFTIGIKVLGVGAAAGLVIVGAVHTVN
jgi:hypothetical protein